MLNVRGLDIKVVIHAVLFARPLECCFAPKQIKTRFASMTATQEDKHMPSEITDVDRFVAMSAKAKQCQVKRLRDTVKLKLRTPRQLYTLKIEPLRADEIIKKLQCEIKEEEK
jgi:ferritin-like protein